MTNETDEECVDWEEIARREVAEAHNRFFEGEVERTLSDYLCELRKPGNTDAEAEALIRLLHRMSSAAEFLVEDAGRVGALDDSEVHTLSEGVEALSAAALVVGDRGLGDAETDRVRLREAVESVESQTDE